MALGSTQPLTEMSTRKMSLYKGGRCVRLTTLPPDCVVFMKFGNLNFLEPSGPLLVCKETALPLPLPILKSSSPSTYSMVRYLLYKYNNNQTEGTPLTVISHCGSRTALNNHHGPLP